MKEDLKNTIVYFIFTIGLLVICLVLFGLGYLKGEDNGENNLIQKLCTQQQYDFCEVIEQKPEYKLKELKQDD